MILLDKYVDFLVTHKINTLQFLLLLLLYKKDMSRLKKYKNTFPTPDGRFMSFDDIKDLEEKGFIVKVANNQHKLGKKFLDIFITPEKATDEIYDLYPAFMVSDKGTNIPLISMDRNIFQKIYIEKIKGSVEEHREVIKDIKYGIHHNLINIGISKFLTSEMWKSIRKRRIPTTSSQLMQDDSNF